MEQFNTHFGVITLLNEPTYSFGSADNVRQYPFAQLLDREYVPTSIHGILLDGNPIVVFGDAGGCSGIHRYSLATLGGACYLAVGRHIVSFTLVPFALRWSLQVDEATCFGVYVNPARNALLSHGELEICRFSDAGNIIWSASGADIFSERFSLELEWVEAVDFNRTVYRFAYEDGTFLT